MRASIWCSEQSPALRHSRFDPYGIHIMFNTNNSKNQGDIGLGQAIAWFSKNGYVVSIPLTDSQEYDLIVDNGSVLQKVQVKTTKYKSKYGIYVCALRTCGGNRSGVNNVKVIDKLKIDLLFVLTEEFRMYLIPCSELVASTNLSLGEDKDIYLV